MAPEKTEEEPTIGRLVNDATQDLSALIRKEIALAKSEIKVSVGFGAVGAGLFAAAAFLALLAVIMFSVALAYFIHWNGSGLSLHWAFLIVFGFYLLVRLHRHQEGQEGRTSQEGDRPGQADPCGA